MSAASSRPAWPARSRPGSWAASAAIALLLASGVLRTAAIGLAGLALVNGSSLAIVFVLVGVESLLSTIVRPLQTAALPFLAATPGELTATQPDPDHDRELGDAASARS